MRIAPDRVPGTLERAVLADGCPFVYVLERSQGSWCVAARTGEEYLDAFSFFAAGAIEHNHDGGAGAVSRTR